VIPYQSGTVSDSALNYQVLCYDSISLNQVEIEDIEKDSTLNERSDEPKETFTNLHFRPTLLIYCKLKGK